mgnify:CR=1 FL=1
MLPDYPKTKRYLRKEFVAAVQKETSKNPLISMIKFREIHEGNTFQLTTDDGFSQKGKYKEMAVPFEISKEEMVARGPEAYFSKVEQIAKEMGTQHSQKLSRMMDEITEVTGNKVDAKSKPLSPELILTALEKVAISFDEFGNPILPTLIVSPEQYEKMKKEIPNWKPDPVLGTRRKLIIAKKRQEWLDRESNRKLVD